MVILILSDETGISLHIPLPMNVANARYHSLLMATIFSFLVANPSRNYGKLQTLGREGLRTKPKAESRRYLAVVRSISNGMPEYTNQFNLDFRKYRDVSQPSTGAQKVVSTSTS